MKDYTTINQSKKLTKLGLDPDTADMVTLHDEPYETSNEKYDGTHKVLLTSFTSYNNEWKKKHSTVPYYPTWSLSKLLDLLPKIDGLKPMIDLEGNSIYYSGHNKFCSNGSTLFESAFDLMCRMLQQKAIEESNDDAQKGWDEYSNRASLYSIDHDPFMVCDIEDAYKAGYAKATQSDTKKKNPKIYILEWETSNMVGGFYAHNLEQCFNTSKETFAGNLSYIIDMNKWKSVEVEYLSSYEDLNKMRSERGMKTKTCLF